MAPSRSKLLTYGTLILILAAAFALRTAWTIPAAQQDGTFVLGESDAYYHKRAINYVQENWEQLRTDEMLNYPIGDVNPNPPLMTWTTAIAGSMVGAVTGDTETATWWVFEYLPAIMGTLTIIPVFLLGRRLVGTSAGLLAAFFLATSTQNMTRSHLGFSDHDAMQLFFTVLGLYFLVRSLDTAPKTRGVRGPAELLSGWIPWMTSTPSGAYAVMAGASFGALALVWKGFPYAFGVTMAFAALQLVINHWQQRDVSYVTYAASTPLVIASLMALPYYVGFGLTNFLIPGLFLAVVVVSIGLFLAFARDYPPVLALPGLGLVGAIAAVIAFFAVPTISRALLSRFVYFKQTTLYQTIAEANPADFNQLSFAIGPFAFFMFFIGLAWIVYRWWRDRQPSQVLVIVWGIVDIFAASSAARFLFTSTPSMAVLAGAGTGALIGLVDFKRIQEVYKALGGGWHAIRRAVNAAHIIVVLAVVFLLILPNAWIAADAAVPRSTELDVINSERDDIIRELGDLMDEHNIPAANRTSVYQIANQTITQMVRGTAPDQPGPDFGRDIDDLALSDTNITASFASAAKRSTADDFGRISAWTERFGAFGPNFISSDWHRALQWLATQDQGMPADERPASLTWWDYGHWTIAIGDHPAVADNFQHGYRVAGSFLTAQNEAHALQIMSARLMRVLDLDTSASILTDAGVPADEARGIAQAWMSEEFQYVDTLDLDASRELVALTEEASGKRIGYYAVDDRMLPLDDPSTRGIETPSIFYAPVLLSGQESSDFLRTPIVDFTSGQEVTEEQFRRLQLDPNFDPSLYGQRMLLEPAFFDTMFYRGFVGTPAQEPFQIGSQYRPQPFSPDQFGRFYQDDGVLIGTDAAVTGSAVANPVLPAYGLTHFRLVYANQGVRYMAYTPGAIVQGQVTLDGEPLAGVRVTAFDDSWDEVRETNPQYFRAAGLSDQELRIPHGSAVTDENGNFELRSVFDTGEGILLRVSQDTTAGGPTPILAQTTINVSREAADSEQVIDQDFDLTPARWEGVVFHDANRNGVWDEDTEEALPNATVQFPQVEPAQTDANGAFSFDELPPGRFNYQVTVEGYTSSGSTQVDLESGQTTTQDIPVRVAPVTVEGQALGPDGDPITGARINLTATETGDNTAETSQAFTNATGQFSRSLQPGQYIIDGQKVQENTTLVVDEVRVLSGNAVASGNQLTVNRSGQPVVLEITYREA